MGDLENTIGSILENPEQMEKIRQIAAQFMGGDDNKKEAPPKNSDTESGLNLGEMLGALGGLGNTLGNAADLGDTLGGIDPGMILKLTKLMAGSSEKSKNAKLLHALGPFLSQKRREKLQKALQIARIAGMAELAFAEGGLFGD